MDLRRASRYSARPARRDLVDRRDKVATFGSGRGKCPKLELLRTIQMSKLRQLSMILKDDDLSRAGAELPHFDGPKKDGWRCVSVWVCPQKKTLEN